MVIIIALCSGECFPERRRKIAMGINFYRQNEVKPRQ